MTLEEAIEHCEDIIKKDDICVECKKEHEQLYEWLLELQRLRGGKMKLRNLEERIQYIKDFMINGGRIIELTGHQWKTMKDFPEHFNDLKFKYVGGKNE